MAKRRPSPSVSFPAGAEWAGRERSAVLDELLQFPAPDVLRFLEVRRAEEITLAVHEEDRRRMVHGVAGLRRDLAVINLVGLGGGGDLLLRAGQPDDARIEGRQIG